MHGVEGHRPRQRRALAWSMVLTLGAMIAEIVGGLVTGTAGVALGMPWMISLGSGMLVPYVHDYVQDTIAGMLEDSNAQQAGPRAVAQ